jgi:hypothetical protein
VAGAHGDAEAGKITGGIAGRVTPGDNRSASNEQLREAAHTGAGDADEVNGATIVRIDERHRGEGSDP